MAEIHRVTCDRCSKDLTYTNNCEDWRIVVASQCMPNHPGGGTVTAMAIPPPLPAALHFCGLRCLRAWTHDELAADTRTDSIR